jgi:molybdate transport system substrate-binding protein
VRRNIRTEEPDVAGVIAKVRAGAVDAGFVYATDVEAVPGLTAIALPEVRADYAAAVVKGGDHLDAARRFVRGLVSGEGRAALGEAGFEPPR